MGTDTNNLKLGIKRGTKMIIFIIILILLMGMTGLTAYLFYIEEKKVKKQQFICFMVMGVLIVRI